MTKHSYPEPRRASLEESPDEGELPYEEESPRHEARGYRVAGTSPSRVLELEEKVREGERRVRDLEIELYATRRTLRGGAALRHASVSGLGSLIGCVVGTGLYAATDNPYFVAVATLVGVLFGGLGSVLWAPRDKSFPDAPPPRPGLL